MSGRPVLAAVEEQQGEINKLKSTVAQAAQVIQAQAAAIDQLIAGQRNLNGRVAMTGRGLQTLSELAGGDVSRQVTASMTKRADVQNPAQPIPEPPAQPAAFSTEETEMPEAFADVTAPGLAPGTTNDVAADATSTVYQPGTDIDMPALNNLIDPTTPVDGTQGPRPLNEVKTHTDVRVGDPMNAQTAFPVQGPWQNAQRTSSRKQGAQTEDAGARTMASLRLAKLHIEAGMAEGDEFAVAAAIEKDATRALSDIEREIENGGKYLKAASRRGNANPEQARGLVPKAANRRAVPSMQQTATAQGGSSDSDDSDLFD